MPLRQRATRALRKAVCICQPSRSPSPVSSSHRSRAAHTKQNTWYIAFKYTVDVVVQVSDVFPPLKSVAAGIKALTDTYDAFSSNQEEFEKLSERLKFLDKILRGRTTLPPEIQDRRDGLARAIEHIAKQLEDKTNRESSKRIAFAKEDQVEIVRLIRELRFAIEFAMLDVAVSNETLILGVVDSIDWLKDFSITEVREIRGDLSGIAQGVATLVTAEQLKRLGDVRDFGYFNKNQRGKCVPGSRVALLAQLLDWAEDRTSAHAFWLSGMAGTGKTAVSETFCSQLSNRGLLGASFFCSIKDQDLSDVYHIIPTLAKTLAATYPEFGGALATILESQSKDPIRQMKISEQYNILIVQPAEEAFRDRKVSVLLCVDALDECKAVVALREFLNTILSKEPCVPIKIFFTSRPEVTVKREVESSAHSTHRQTLRLHDIEKDMVRADIKLYVTDALGKLPELQDEYGERWPPLEVDRIVERSDALFIIAATIVRQIGEAGDPVARLLTYGGVDAPKLSGVDELYRDIMDRAMSRLEPREEEDVLLCLSLVVVARRPLCMVDYSALLDRPISAIGAAFRSLHSVVELPADRDSDRPISIYHASFFDFLTHQLPEAATTVEVKRPPWAVDRTKSHGMILERCLFLMDSNDPMKGLYMGVSGASTSYRSNDDQPHGLPLPRSDLAYACTSWANHALDGMPIANNLQTKIQTFLQTKGLYWLEALSAQKNVDYPSILWDLSNSKGLTVDGLAKLLVSVRDFAQMFATPISHSAPHVYLSALPFFEAAFRQPGWWQPHFPSIPVARSTKAVDPSNGRIFARFPGVVHLCIAVSHDGSRLASGVKSRIQVWNIQSGEAVGDPMVGHSKSIKSISFSPDGSRIVSGSGDHTIRIWDAWSGRPVLGPMEGHSESVTSVAFSPDGTRIVSGSGDRTVRVWDTQSGKLVLGPIEGHSNTVACVGFNPDGTRIVSAAGLAICVWDAHTGEPALHPITGHKGPVASVAFSPDGRRIVSGSWDETVRVWDAQSGKPALRPFEGHSFWVKSVAFSPDGTRIVSGSDDETIRVWDAREGEPLGLFKGHASPVGFAAFTPDGTGIVSGSMDGTIRLWRSPSVLTVSDPIDGHAKVVAPVASKPQAGRIQVQDAPSVDDATIAGHSGHITCAAFSPDGTKIVSGSDDHTVWLWDAQNGQSLFGPMKGPSSKVLTVGFTPDGRQIVSGSWVAEIHVWDALTGEPESGLTQERRHAVTSAVFSAVNEGARIIFTSSRDEGIIQVWDVRGKEPVSSPIPRHRVNSVALSPDGSEVVSGSDDPYTTRVRVSDIRSTKPVLRLGSTGSPRATSVAFSPDGTKIISGFRDGTIVVWDVQSGEPALNLISGRPSSVTSVAFSPDGTRAVSGSDDGTIHLWDALSGEPVPHPIVRHSARVTSLAFSPDGTRILSVSDDHRIMVWDAQYGQTASKAAFLHQYPYPSLYMDEDGWVRNASSDLLIWIPPRFRPSIYLPPVELIIGGSYPPLELELSHAIHHGTEWKECTAPRQAEPCAGFPWPITTENAGPVPNPTRPEVGRSFNSAAQYPVGATWMLANADTEEPPIRYVDAQMDTPETLWHSTLLKSGIVEHVGSSYYP